MSIFTFKAEGKLMPAFLRVVAVELTAARATALVWCNENDVDPGSLSLEDVEPFKTPMIVHSWRGDYQD